jgi:hypothetical protein
MADIIIDIIDPATSQDLMTLEDIKIMFGIPATDTSQDEQFQLLITIYSDIIATMCNRTFAKEKLTETWRDLQDNRVFLSHYPVASIDDIESVECPRGTIMDPSGYEIEFKSGKIELYQSQSEPIVVTYTGGYDLPEEAPPALKQALIISIREERRQMQIASAAGIRSLSHKESRVVYFDPNAALSKSVGGSSSGLKDTIENLLMHYVRIQV